MKHLSAADHRLWTAIAIVVVGFLSYGRVVTFNFVDFDDDMLVSERTAYLSHLSNIPDAFRQDYWGGTREKSWKLYYRPMVTVSFILDGVIAPASPLVSHLTNVLLHICAALLVFVVFRRLLTNTDMAAAAALLFAAHPLASNAVGWIPGRNDLLLACFVLLAFIGFIAYVRKASVVGLAGFAIAFACALFTKETAVAAPLLFLAWLAVSREDRHDLRWLPPTIAACGIVAMWWIVRSHVITDVPPPMGLSLLANLPVLLQGLGKSILPVNLSPLATITDTGIVPGILAIACIGALMWKIRRENIARPLFGLMWFLLLLAPSLMTGQDTGIPVLECRLYLPLVGILFVVAESPAAHRIRSVRHARWILAGVLVLMIGLSNWFSEPYRNPEVLWDRAVRSAPSSSLAHLNYGWILETHHEPYRAEAQYREAMRLDPRNPLAHSNLGDILRARGALDSAEREYRTQLEISSTPFAWYGLAEIALQRNDGALAIQYLRTSVEISPLFPEGWLSLAQAYVQTNNRIGAQACAEKLRSLNVTVPGAVSEFLSRH